MRVAMRVDASPIIGAGHVMRCLSLADGLRQRGATVSFVSRSLPAHLTALIERSGHELLAIGAADDAADTARRLGDARLDWLVVDHYGLDARWETAVRGVAARIFVIDDLADRAHDCDLLLDQGLHADAAQRYEGRVPSRCELLLGPRFALLRDGFRKAREAATARAGDVSRALVSFGGSDTANHTALAIEAIHSTLPDLAQVDVVIGASHAHRDAIAEACRRHGYRCHVQSDRMPELMAAADLAIGAGGITTWERCCVGLPAVVFAVASNQEAVVEQAARHALIYAVDAPVTAARLGLHLRALADNAAQRHRLSCAGLKTVDGLGVSRVVQAMALDDIQVREAVPGDARPMLEWRNHESVRRAARRPDPVTWAEHEAWLSAVSSDANRYLLIGEHGGKPVGVVRFDVGADVAEVSIYRVPTSPERGLGVRLLRAAERWLAERRPDVTRLTADVLAGNQRSHRLFQSAGYQPYSLTYEKRVHA